MLQVIPKNILMIGSTGCGKTEVARRLAKIADAPFVKTDATKYTEVGKFIYTHKHNPSFADMFSLPRICGARCQRNSYGSGRRSNVKSAAADI